LTGSIRTWIPASVLVVALAVLMVAATVIASERPISPEFPSPASGTDLHSPPGATVAIRHHSQVEAEAQGFGKDLGLRSTAATPADAPSVGGFTAPQVRAGVLARLQPGGPPVSDRGLAAIEAPRGTPVFIYVRPIVDAEGTMTVGGLAVASGHTELVRWRLNTGSLDGPPGHDTPAGAVGGPTDAVVQQWDSPDHLGPRGAEPYLVAFNFTVRTRYPDGQTRDYDFAGAIRVAVAFAASSG
jgi:hypothetical protein